MGDRSTDKLVAALEAASAPAEIVDKARAGAFHDFRSESATPIIDLVLACEGAGLRNVAAAARNGEFDASRKEAKQWAASEEGRATIGRVWRNDADN